MFAASLLLAACTLTYHVPRSEMGKSTAASSSTRTTAAPSSSSNRAVVPAYRVVNGDTLYSIAWRYRMDYKQLAWWNRINPPYLIKTGQLLRLKPRVGQSVLPPKVVASQSRPAVARPSTAPSSLPTRPVASQSAPPKPAIVKPAPVAVPEPEKTPVLARSLNWRWPVRGPLLDRFGENPGINIGGKFGQAVLASEAGRVVYSGGGLKGYGDLIIIKHDDAYLSAYAHNSRLLVKEGDSVYSGQTIAQLGKLAEISMLHFEIRIEGEPVDPLKFLPPN